MFLGKIVGTAKKACQYADSYAAMLSIGGSATAILASKAASFDAIAFLNGKKEIVGK